MSGTFPSTLRRFEPADLEAVRDLIHRTIDVSYAGVYPPRALEWFKRHHSREHILARHCDGVVLVIEQEGVVVATGSVVAGGISGVFVDPAFRGRGHGAALMRALESQARCDGCRESKLNVSLPSRGFYEALGYRLEESSFDLGAGQRLDYWKGSKWLG